MNLSLTFGSEGQRDGVADAADAQWQLPHHNECLHCERISWDDESRVIKDASQSLRHCLVESSLSTSHSRQATVFESEFPLLIPCHPLRREQTCSLRSFSLLTFSLSCHLFPVLSFSLFSRSNFRPLFPSPFALSFLLPSCLASIACSQRQQLLQDDKAGEAG